MRASTPSASDRDEDERAPSAAGSHTGTDARTQSAGTEAATTFPPGERRVRGTRPMPPSPVREPQPAPREGAREEYDIGRPCEPGGFLSASFSAATRSHGHSFAVSGARCKRSGVVLDGFEYADSEGNDMGNGCGEAVSPSSSDHTAGACADEASGSDLHGFVADADSGAGREGMLREDELDSTRFTAQPRRRRSLSSEHALARASTGVFSAPESKLAALPEEKSTRKVALPSFPRADAALPASDAHVPSQQLLPTFEVMGRVQPHDCSSSCRPAIALAREQEASTCEAMRGFLNDSVTRAPVLYALLTEHDRLSASGVDASRSFVSPFAPLYEAAIGEIITACERRIACACTVDRDAQVEKLRGRSNGALNISTYSFDSPVSTNHASFPALSPHRTASPSNSSLSGAAQRFSVAGGAAGSSALSGSAQHALWSPSHEQFAAASDVARHRRTASQSFSCFCAAGVLPAPAARQHGLLPHAAVDATSLAAPTMSVEEPAVMPDAVRAASHGFAPLAVHEGRVPLPPPLSAVHTLPASRSASAGAAASPSPPHGGFSHRLETLPPSESVQRLLCALDRQMRYQESAPLVFMAALAYLSRVATRCVSAYASVTAANWFRLTVVALLAASKMYNEYATRRLNRVFAEASGIPLAQVNRLEVDFLYLLDFDLLLEESDMESWARWMEAVAARNGMATPLHAFMTLRRADGAEAGSESGGHDTEEVSPRAVSSGCGAMHFRTPSLCAAGPAQLPQSSFAGSWSPGSDRGGRSALTAALSAPASGLGCVPPSPAHSALPPDCAHVESPRAAPSSTDGRLFSVIHSRAEPPTPPTVRELSRLGDEPAPPLALEREPCALSPVSFFRRRDTGGGSRLSSSLASGGRGSALGQRAARAVLPHQPPVAASGDAPSVGGGDGADTSEGLTESRHPSCRDDSAASRAELNSGPPLATQRPGPSSDSPPPETLSPSVTAPVASSWRGRLSVMRRLREAIDVTASLVRGRLNVMGNDSAAAADPMSRGPSAAKRQEVDEVRSHPSSAAATGSTRLPRAAGGGCSGTGTADTLATDERSSRALPSAPVPPPACARVSSVVADANGSAASFYPVVAPTAASAQPRATGRQDEARRTAYDSEKETARADCGALERVPPATEAVDALYAEDDDEDEGYWDDYGYYHYYDDEEGYYDEDGNYYLHADDEAGEDEVVESDEEEEACRPPPRTHSPPTL